MTSRLMIALATLAVFAACGSDAATAEQGGEAAELPRQTLAAEISPQAFAAMTTSPARPADLVLIDVRTPEEFAQGHLEGATNIDWKSGDFAARVEALPKDKEYVLYCRTGRRSAEAREAMVKMGFASVTSMTGGIEAWQQGEMPVLQ